jgi:hypothetical protein
MKHLLFALALTEVCFLSACSSSTVRQDSPPIVGLRNPSVQFLVDNTKPLPATGRFDWGFGLFHVERLPKLDLSAVDKLIHESLLKTLEKKGFVKTDAAPDFLVSYALTSGANLDETELDEAYGDAAKSMPHASGNPAKPDQYRQGTLIIDIVEAKTKHLLWRGAILADIEVGLSDEQKRARCQGAVDELLRHYPKP